MLWRRLDTPGLDSARLVKTTNGRRLVGGAVFAEGGVPCHLAYDVRVDASWRARSARVVGHAGTKSVDLRIARAAGGAWTLDGKVAAATRGCPDIDLGFTPSTNQLAVRRLALRVGERADAPAAYLEFPALKLTRLPQTYRRLDARRYEYASPTASYRGVIEVARDGSVVRYPGVFERVDGA